MNREGLGAMSLKRIVAAAAAVFGLVLAVRAVTADPPASPEEAAIRAVLDAQVESWNKADLDGFMAGYWKNDAMTFISGGDISRGWSAARERYIKRYQAEGKDKMGQLKFEELHVELVGPSAAIVHGKYELVRGERKDWGRFTLALKKFPEGWRIIHDHTSVGPAEKEKK
jgi:uncharacterized protein (TIGR02246 family)